MNQDQENKAFEVIGRLYFNLVASGEENQKLQSQLSQLQSQAIAKQGSSLSKIDDLFVEQGKIKPVKSPEKTDAKEEKP